MRQGSHRRVVSCGQALGNAEAIHPAPPRALTRRPRPRRPHRSRQRRAAPERRPGTRRGRQRSANSRPRDHRPTTQDRRHRGCPHAAARPASAAARAGTSNPICVLDPYPYGAAGEKARPGVIFRASPRRRSSVANANAVVSAETSLAPAPDEQEEPGSPAAERPPSSAFVVVRASAPGALAGRPQQAAPDRYPALASRRKRARGARRRVLPGSLLRRPDQRPAFGE